MKAWYQLKQDTILVQLKVDPSKGLGIADAKQRLQTQGRNELRASKGINPFKLFLSQFQDVLIIILLLAAGVSYGLTFVEDGGSTKESLLIVGIVIAIALVGFFNEYKAEKTVEALKQLVAYKARV